MTDTAFQPTEETIEDGAKPDEASSAPTITKDLIEEHGLTHDEYEKVLNIVGREPNLVELGIFSVMWSEHCSYKTTRKHLKNLPTKGEQVICGPGENAGVIDIGDNQAIIFKMESHNHPSFIEPFQGAATGVGGILRDVFTMGARPIALMNALRFGDPGHPKTRHLVSGVVKGISFYGNCVGVPTVGGECNFHPSYNGNILVNAMCVGLADQDKIFYSAASGVGNPVVYVGAKTGRDGIHGATMASAEFDEKTEEKRPTVQVGDPFKEKLLIEACLELMDTDAIIAIQDMGAAGLTCSSLEMASKGGLGIELDLDKVPQREPDMSAYEIMLSESQERMLMVLKPECEEMAHEIFKKWELDVATVGTMTDTGHLVLKHNGETVCDIPVDPLSEEAPILDRPYMPTPKRAEVKEQDVPAPANLGKALRSLMGSPDIASKRWIWQQYDHMVGNDTVERPGGDAAVVRVHGSKKGVAISTDCTPRYCFADPIEGGKQAVAEAWRNLTAVGADPLAITNCLNFGNPEKKEIMGQLVGCLEGMSAACETFNFPVVSGNVSLYNETHGEGIFPTPAIGGVGVLPDIDMRVGKAITHEGDHILLAGDTWGHLGSSLYLRHIEGREDGAPPPVDLDIEKRNGDAVRKILRHGWARACHDISDGGMLVALAEMMMPKNIGASITLDPVMTPHAFCFGEDQARYLLVVPHEHKDTVLVGLNQADVPVFELGKTGGDDLVIEDVVRLPVSMLSEVNELWLPGYMSA